MEVINGLALLARVRVEVTPSGQKKPVCSFRCTCGVEFEARLYDVNSGKTSSCGCAYSRPRSHGAAHKGSFTPEYRSYRNMLTRGRNPNHIHAHRYALRGIGVADEWLPGADGQGFARFFAHVGPRPSHRHSLDRIDNDRGYEPGNVRWASPIEQALNKSSTRWLTVNEETLPLTTWAHRKKLPPGVVRERIDKLGWSPERALSEPLRKDKRRIPYNPQPGV